MRFDKNIRKHWFKEFRFVLSSYSRGEAYSFLLASIVLGFTTGHYDLLKSIIDKNLFHDDIPF